MRLCCWEPARLRHPHFHLPTTWGFFAPDVSASGGGPISRPDQCHLGVLRFMNATIRSVLTRLAMTMAIHTTDRLKALHKPLARLRIAV